MSLIIALFLEGNLPIFLARWRVINQNGNLVLILDNCGTLPTHRNCGFARVAISQIISNCVASLAISTVIIYLPAYQLLIEKIIPHIPHCRIENYSESREGSNAWKAFTCTFIPTH